MSLMEQDFMVRLRRLERLNVTVRQLFILWAVKSSPGMSGIELSRKLGYASRSTVQQPMGELIRRKMIEDRRDRVYLLTPNKLYLLPAGLEILEGVMP